MRRVAALAAGLERNLAIAWTQQIPNSEKHQPADVILSVVIKVDRTEILENGPRADPEVRLAEQNKPGSD